MAINEEQTWLGGVVLVEYRNAVSALETRRHLVEHGDRNGNDHGRGAGVADEHGQHRRDYHEPQHYPTHTHKILFTGCYFVTFINFVHRPSHILCVFLLFHCMHVRMPYVLIKELTYL